MPSGCTFGFTSAFVTSRICSPIIRAQHQCSFGWVEIQPDDIADFLDQLGIGRQLECFGAMWLEAEGFPDPMHALTGHAARCSHRANAPVRRVSWCGLECLNDHRLDLVVRNAARRAATRLVQQGGDTSGHKPRSPLADGRIRQAQLACNLAVGTAVATPQHDLRTSRKSMRSLAPRRPAFQCRPVFGRQL